MALDPNEIEERLRLAGNDWSDLDYAASLLEETKKSVRAELVNKAEGGSMAAKESQAEADPVYKLHITNMCAARRDANRAKVKYDSAKVWVDLVRTSEATKRQEMRG
jgi:hypothetical protein